MGSVTLSVVLFDPLLALREAPEKSGSLNVHVTALAGVTTRVVPTIRAAPQSTRFQFFMSFCYSFVEDIRRTTNVERRFRRTSSIPQH